MDFTGAWRAARQLPRPPRAGEMDAVLHRERTGRLRQKVTHLAPAGELPDGVMVWVGGGAALLLGGRLRYVARPIPGRGAGVCPVDHRHVWPEVTTHFARNPHGVQCYENDQ